MDGNTTIAEMWHKYGEIIAPMGCVDGSEVVTYKIGNRLYVEAIRRMWDRMESLYDAKVQKNGDPHLYIDTDQDIQIYDKDNKFVPVRRMVRNVSTEWAIVKLSNGRMLECTLDHPLPVIGKGRTFVKDLQIGDRIPINKTQYTEEKYQLDEDTAWMMGVFLCDGCYDNQACVSTDINGEDEIEYKLEDVMAKVFDSSLDVKYRHRGKKGDYKDLRFSNPSKISREFVSCFGGLQKKYRQIPNFIFSCNERVRLAFLAGMIDADGYINYRHGLSRIQLGSTNKELALQQMMLMQSLGARGSVYPNRYKSNSDKIRYRVECDCIPGIEEFIQCQKKKDNIQGSGRVKSNPSDVDEAVVKSIEYLDKVDFSYDVTTESDHFDVSGIYSHNCRAFLSPYYERGGMTPADENDRPFFTGRFNIGVVSLNLPMIYAKAQKEGEDFYTVLDEYLELGREVHKKTYEYLGELKASTNPLAFCQGGVHGGFLSPRDKIKPLLKYTTASFGITALNELNRIHNKKSIREDGEFPLEVMKYINDKINQFKKEDGILYAIYGTPAESLCLAGETLVQTSKGCKEIKDITTSDLVYTYNENTKKVELKPVIAAGCSNSSAEVIEVICSNGQTFVTTPNHPFGVRVRETEEYPDGKIVYGDETIQYVDAIYLRPEMHLKTNYIHESSSNKMMYENAHTVVAIKRCEERIPVYNLTVADNHNFFIGAPDGILVHNCYKQVEQFRKMYGIVENVSDREYVSNSFHCHVSEEMDGIEKQDKEARFWNYLQGGRIQYVRYNTRYNTEAIKTYVKRAMKMGLYEGVNFALCYCEDCGHDGTSFDECPKCGSKNIVSISRMNGYLSYSRIHGDTRLNHGKMAEIADRKSM